MPSKRTYINLLKGSSIIIILLLIPRACIEMRISDEEALVELSEMKIKPTFSNVEVMGRNMHYISTNQGKETLIVFVHGSPGSWSAFIDFFKEDSLLTDVDMLSIDRPGFGESGFGHSEASLEIQAKLLHAVIQKFNHKRKVLIGHSLGGPVIARLAMDYPTSFDGLIFVAASIDPEMEKDEWFRSLIKSPIGNFFTPKEFVASNDEIMSLKEELKLMLPLWEKISIPSVVIQGTEDWLVPKENADFAKKMIADSLLSMRLLEGANHFIPWSNKGVITEAIYQLIAPQ